MIFSVTLSKPVKNIRELLGDDYMRVRIKYLPSSKNEGEDIYFAEFFTEKQVFHKKMSVEELSDFLSAHEGTSFRSCVERTEKSEIQILSNKKGKITRIERPFSEFGGNQNQGEKKESNLEKLLHSPGMDANLNRKKNHIIKEGNPVPFLVMLGVMTAEGKVISGKHDKFRQINRFLEFLDDIASDVIEKKRSSGDGTPLSIIDFGSGKSYLTFAMHYYFCEIKKIDCVIFGLDLKKDVIDYCNSLAERLGLKNISFATGDIASFGEDKKADIVVTLHACDTATDFALDYAIKKKALAILSVPCCQHELNKQLAPKSADGTPLDALGVVLKHGLLKERFSALLTDAIRCEILEEAGYKVSVLEFIDDAGTPKNVLIRAVIRGKQGRGRGEIKILGELGIKQTLSELSL